jgi:hypothetical protein
VVELGQALGFLPEVRLDGEPARRARHGGAVPGWARGPVRLTDEHGVIAIAEPAPGETLKPVVGLRG